MAFSITSMTKDNCLCVEEAPTGVTFCTKCQYLIEEGDLRVSFYRSQRTTVHYHLSCFTPFTHLRIDPQDIFSIVQRKRSPENQQRLQHWLAKWNKQFLLSRAQATTLQEKCVQTKAPDNKRVLLEAFKFLQADAIGRVVTRVCKDWYHVSWEAELWSVVSERAASSKPAYLQWLLSACMHCNAVLAPKDRFMICPVFNRPKCRPCYAKKKYRPWRLRWIFSEYKLTRDYLLKVGATFFQFDGVECCYLYQAKRLVEAHRESIIWELLARDSENVLGEMRLVLARLNRKDLWRLSFRRVFARSLSVFDLAKKVQKFVQTAKNTKQCEKMLTSLRADSENAKT